MMVLNIPVTKWLEIKKLKRARILLTSGLLKLWLDRCCGLALEQDLTWPMAKPSILAQR